jgi:hypothetical protein
MQHSNKTRGKISQGNNLKITQAALAAGLLIPIHLSQSTLKTLK